MPSSRADALARTYDLAFEALARDDFERAAALLAKAQTLIDLHPDLDADAVLAVEQSFGRLAGALHAAIDNTRADLRQTRDARRVLHTLAQVDTFRSVP